MFNLFVLIYSQKQTEVKDVRRKLEKAKGDLSSLKANRKMLM